MAISTGTVKCIRVTEGVAALQIDKDGGGVETFFLWFVDDTDTAAIRIVRSMWLSLLRDALVSKSRVLIGHSDMGGRVEIVEMARV